MPTAINSINEESPVKVFNKEIALARMGGDAESLKLVLQTFLNHSGDLTSELRAVIDKKDYEALCRCAHTIKGSLSTLAADTCVPLAKELQEIGRRQDINTAIAAYAKLEQEINRFIQAITNYVEGSES